MQTNRNDKHISTIMEIVKIALLLKNKFFLINIIKSACIIYSEFYDEVRRASFVIFVQDVKN